MPQPESHRLLALECRPCDGGDCPRITSDGEYIYVQGDDTSLPAGPGERIVRIPRTLLHEAARNDA